jgi:hypothetical protein
MKPAVVLSLLASLPVACLLLLFPSPTSANQPKNSSSTAPAESAEPNRPAAQPAVPSSAAAACSGDTISIPRPGIANSVWTDGTVSLAIPLENNGQVTLPAVQITSIAIRGGTLLAPASFPVPLGEILPDGIKVAYARFSLPQIGPTLRYAVVVNGIFTTKGISCQFQVQGGITPVPLSTAPIPSKPGRTTKFTARTAKFPMDLPKPQKGRQPNGEFLAVTPLGPPRNFFTTTPPGTNIGTPVPITSSQHLPNGTAQPNPNDVVFSVNTLGATYGGNPPDPSVAGEDASNVVMFTANTAVFYSTDGGQTFTGVPLTSGFSDPAIPGRNSFFPEDDAGLCCDQVLHYVPSRNLYVWLLQYWPPSQTINFGFFTITITLPNRLRIAWATPQALAADFLHAWSWADITSGAVGISPEWMDYPDLAFSDNFLYVGVDHGIEGDGKVYGDRHIFVRMSLDDMANPSASSVGYSYMEPSRGNIYQNHIVQSSHDTFYWSALPDTSTLTLFTWPDSSNSATQQDIPISSYSTSDYSAPAPDFADWNAAPKNALGATRVDPFHLCPPSGCTGPTKFVYFAFSAGRDNNAGRPFPYIRVEKIDPDAPALFSESDIYNPGFAFSTPAFVSRPGSGRDEVAVSLAYGGGGNYGNNAVGFLGDSTLYITTDSDTTQASYALDKNGNIILDSNGNPTYSVRFGDYYSTRNSVGPPTPNGRGVGFSTLGYAVKANTAGQACYITMSFFTTGCHIDLHYVQFGRFGDLFPSPPPPPPK